jgi:oxygen-independent coproporphyrinogen-3 oxidase
MSTRAWASPAPADTLRFPPEACFEAGERNHHVSNTAYPIAHNATWGPYRASRP